MLASSRKLGRLISARIIDDLAHQGKMAPVLKKAARVPGSSAPFANCARPRDQEIGDLEEDREPLGIHALDQLLIASEEFGDDLLVGLAAFGGEGQDRLAPVLVALLAREPSCARKDRARSG